MFVLIEVIALLFGYFFSGFIFFVEEVIEKLRKRNPYIYE